MNFWIVIVEQRRRSRQTGLVYDRKTKKLTLLQGSRKARPQRPFADEGRYGINRRTASRFLPILTIPKGSTGKNLPTVLYIHGGPWGRDSWGYHSYAQFLANRGYAVLQPNFRASTGYGKKFLNAGNNEWGQKMQDDITWGKKYLVEQGIADPKRVAIMGGSYGGYATLAGVTFTPDEYAAAVAIVAPSNLMTPARIDPAVLGSASEPFFTSVWATRTRRKDSRK